MTFWKSLVSTLSRDETSTHARKNGRQSVGSDGARRRGRMREGFLWADGLIMPRPCTIRDISPLTAEIVLWHDDIKPATLRGPLTLFSSTDRKEVDCIVAHRRANVLSLRLQSAMREPSRRYP